MAFTSLAGGGLEGWDGFGQHAGRGGRTHLIVRYRFGEASRAGARYVGFGIGTTKGTCTHS